MEMERRSRSKEEYAYDVIERGDRSSSPRGLKRSKGVTKAGMAVGLIFLACLLLFGAYRWTQPSSDSFDSFSGASAFPSRIDEEPSDEFFDDHPSLLTDEEKKRKEVFTQFFHDQASRFSPNQDQTTVVRQFVGEMIQKYGIKSMLSAWCGDATWQTEIPGISKVEYTGVDVVPEVLKNNRKKVKGDLSMRFLMWDVITTPIDVEFDLVFSYDTLHFLPMSDAQKVINNIRNSNATYFISPFYSVDSRQIGETCNVELPVGEPHFINFHLSPFNFPEPLDYVVDDNEKDKHLGLWRVEDLPRQFPQVAPEVY